MGNVTEKQNVRCTCVTVLPALVTFRGDVGSNVCGGKTHIRRPHTKQRASLYSPRKDGAKLPTTKTDHCEREGHY